MIQTKFQIGPTILISMQRARAFVGAGRPNVWLRVYTQQQHSCSYGCLNCSTSSLPQLPASPCPCKSASLSTSTLLYESQVHVVRFIFLIFNEVHPEDFSNWPTYSTALTSPLQFVPLGRHKLLHRCPFGVHSYRPRVARDHPGSVPKGL